MRSLVFVLILAGCASPNPEKQVLLAECQRYPHQYGYPMTYEAWAAAGSSSMESPGAYCLRVMRRVKYP